MLKLKGFRLRRFKCPAWLQQKRVHRIGVAMITATLAFCLGELFSSTGGFASSLAINAFHTSTCVSPQSFHCVVTRV